MDTYHLNHFEDASHRFRATERKIAEWLHGERSYRFDECATPTRHVVDLDGELAKMRHHAKHVEYPYEPGDVERWDAPTEEEFYRGIKDELKTAEAVAKAVGDKVSTQCVRAT